MKIFYYLSILMVLTVSSLSAEARKRHHRGHAEKENFTTSEKCPSGDFAKRTYLTNYYTPVLSTAKCKEDQLGLLNFSDKEHGGDSCRQSTIDGVVKRMEGAGIILHVSGRHEGVLVSPKGPIQEILNSGLNFSEVPPRGTPSEMFHVATPLCPLGYGHKTDGKPVCLDPFRTIACSPQHRIGDVAFIPATVGIKYPDFPGQRKSEYESHPGHDGYFVCGDIGSAIQGEHADIFIGFINPYSKDNPFEKLSSTRQFGVCWVPRDIANDPEHRYAVHSARDLNPSFPALDLITISVYTDKAILRRAFGLDAFVETKNETSLPEH